jgi:cell division protease FtsH
MFCDDISSGAQSDIQQATNIARQMVLTWGMSDELGLISYEPDTGLKELYYVLPGEKDYSDKTAETIDGEVKKLIDESYHRSKELIEANKDRLDAIAKALLKYETLDADDVEVLLAGGTLNKPTVSDLLATEKAKSEQKKSDGQA